MEEARGLAFAAALAARFLRGLAAPTIDIAFGHAIAIPHHVAAEAVDPADTRFASASRASPEGEG